MSASIFAYKIVAGKTLKLTFSTCFAEKVHWNSVKETRLYVIVSFTGQERPCTGSLRNSYVKVSEKLSLFLMSGPPNSTPGVMFKRPIRWSFFPRKDGTMSSNLKFHPAAGGRMSILVKPPENPPYAELSGVL